jgi:hypothetical protein
MGGPESHAERLGDAQDAREEFGKLIKGILFPVGGSTRPAQHLHNPNNVDEKLISQPS